MIVMRETQPRLAAGRLVRTGFSPLGQTVTFPAKCPLAQLSPSGQCAQRPMFTEFRWWKDGLYMLMLCI